jgi:hypothetical protein
MTQDRRRNVDKLVMVVSMAHLVVNVVALVVELVRLTN